jgi:hypothetical protein
MRFHSVLKCPVQRAVHVHPIHGLSGCVGPHTLGTTGVWSGAHPSSERARCIRRTRRTAWTNRPAAPHGLLDSNLGPLGYELTSRCLPQSGPSHTFRSTAFRRPTCFIVLGLFASNSPCSVPKSVPNTANSRLSGSTAWRGSFAIRIDARETTDYGAVRKRRHHRSVLLAHYHRRLSRRPSGPVRSFVASAGRRRRCDR